MVNLNQLDQIELENLQTRCIIGILEAERASQQTVQIDAKLFLDTRLAASDGDIAKTVDYSRVQQDLIKIAQQGRFRLLETAAHAMIHYLLFPWQQLSLQRTAIEAAQIRISKREVFADGSIPSLTIHRTRHEIDWGQHELVCWRRDAEILIDPATGALKISPL